MRLYHFAFCCSFRVAAAYRGALDDVASTVGRVQASLDSAVASRDCAGRACRVDGALSPREVRRALALRRHCVVRLEGSALADTKRAVEADLFSDLDGLENRVGRAAAVSPNRSREYVGVFRTDRSTFVELRFDDSGRLVPRTSPAMDAAAGASADVARRVLASLDRSVEILELADQPASRRREASASVQRACYYDASGDRDEVFGVHTDTTWLTVIPFASEPGLEVFDGAGWVRPEADPDADPDTDVLIMAGELLDLVSAGHYAAAPHRVVLANRRPRLSLPFLLRAQPTARFRDAFFMADVWNALQTTSPDQARRCLAGKQLFFEAG